MYISIPGIAVAIILIIYFNKSIKKIVLYTDELVEINTAEDRLDFHKRANDIALKLENLGPVRVKDLENLFEEKGIPTTKPKELTNAEQLPKRTRKPKNKPVV